MKSFLREYLFPSVGKSWETLPNNKPISTKSYTNKYLVFKGLCLHKNEVLPSVSSNVDTAWRVWKYQVLGLEGWTLFAIQWFKKTQFQGTFIPSSLYVCISWSKTTYLGSFGPSPAQHGVPVCVGNWIWFSQDPTLPHFTYLLEVLPPLCTGERVRQLWRNTQSFCSGAKRPGFKSWCCVTLGELTME